jgi:DNA-binding response OmpR family regulator
VTVQTAVSSTPSDPPPSPARGRILVVEDEPQIAGLLTEILRTDGYEVWSVATGGEAEAMLGKVRPDLVLLDIMLPDTDGLVLCSQIHARWPGPIVMVSGTKSHRDRILSLRLGADDFIAKPFDIDELIARVDAVLRRAGPPHVPPTAQPAGGATGAGISPLGEGRPWGPGPSAVVEAGGGTVYQIGQLEIDLRRRSVTIGGSPVHLTPTENRLLTMLASDPERVYSRDELAAAIWGTESLGESRAVDVHIRRLRAKLEPFGEAAPAIVTVRGFGYKLAADSPPSA